MYTFFRDISYKNILLFSLQKNLAIEIQIETTPLYATGAFTREKNSKKISLLILN